MRSRHFSGGCRFKEIKICRLTNNEKSAKLKISYIMLLIKNVYNYTEGRKYVIFRRRD